MPDVTLFCHLSKVELVRNLVAHSDTREGNWRRNWRMEWVASTLTPPPNVVYPALLKLMRTPRLPAVDWTDAPNDLNGLVRFEERRNLVSAHVSSRSARAIPLAAVVCQENWLFQIWHNAKISFLSILIFDVLAGSSLPIIDMFVSLFQKWHARRRSSYKLGIPFMSVMFAWNSLYTFFHIRTMHLDIIKVLFIHQLIH